MDRWHQDVARLVITEPDDQLREVGLHRIDPDRGEGVVEPDFLSRHGFHLRIRSGHDADNAVVQEHIHSVPIVGGGHTGRMTASTPSRAGRRRAAWAVPVLVLGAVVGGGVAMSSASADPHPTLPARTPAQLLVAVQTSQVTGLSGTIRETARLGLPALPGSDGGASLSWQSFVTGSHTARVWVAGPDKQRIAVLGTLSEADVVHNGRDLWTYTSNTNEVTHTVLSAQRRDGPGDTADVRSYTPMAAALHALKAIDPSTVVGVDRTQVVAGRKAYTLVLAPRAGGSTVRKVTIAIDSSRFVPLRVQVFGAASAPAFQTGFIGHLSFATPKASIFSFHVPAGATVVSDPFRQDRNRGPGRAEPSSGASPKVIGTGWTSVVEFPGGLPNGWGTGLLDKLTTPVGTGGNRLFASALLNALILKDGRVFLGAVTPGVLERIAAVTPR